MSKIFLPLIILLFSFPAFAQSPQIAWDTPYPVAPSSSGNVRPQIALDAQENPIILSGIMSPGEHYVVKWNGGGFSVPVVLNPAGVEPFVMNWASGEIASSGDSVYVVYKSNPADTGKVYVHHSYNGGLTFSDTVSVEYPSVELSRFPSVTTGASGNLYVMFMSFNSNFTNAQYTVATSSDGGNTFTPDVPASGITPGDVCDCCPGAIVAKDNIVVALFRNNFMGLRDIWASVSYDGGQSFTATTDIDNSNWNISSCPSSGPSAYIEGDTLYYTYMSAATGNSRIYFGALNLLTMQVGYNYIISDAVTGYNVNYPKVAGKGDSVVVTWQQNTQAGTKIMFSYSLAGPANIGQYYDTLPSGANANLTNPDLVYRDGKFHLVVQSNSSGQVSYVSFSLSTNTGVNEILSSGNQYYFNKDNMLLFIDKDLKDFDAEIFDIRGRSLIRTKNKHQIDLKNLKQGIYLVHIKVKTTGKEKLNTGKLVLF